MKLLKTIKHDEIDPGIKSIDDYIDQAKIKDGDIQFIKKSEISSRRELLINKIQTKILEEL